MQSFVALLRGINVGGNNILPMKDLRALLSDLGCDDVATYIQSGNAVFRYAGDAAAISRDLSKAIESAFAFKPVILVLPAAAFAATAAENPYAAKAADPKHVHISFLSTPADGADLARMKELASDDEEFELTDRGFYLHAPQGIGRSKLAASSEKCLGVAATARNGRSVGKLLEMLEKLR